MLIKYGILRSKEVQLLQAIKWHKDASKNCFKL